MQGNKTGLARRSLDSVNNVVLETQPVSIWPSLCLLVYMVEVETHGEELEVSLGADFEGLGCQKLQQIAMPVVEGSL